MLNLTFQEQLYFLVILITINFIFSIIVYFLNRTTQANLDIFKLKINEVAGLLNSKLLELKNVNFNKQIEEKEQPIIHSIYYNTKKIVGDNDYPFDRIEPYLEIVNNSTALKLELPYNDALEFIIENKLDINLDDFKLAKDHYKVWCQTPITITL